MFLEQSEYLRVNLLGFGGHLAIGEDREDDFVVVLVEEEVVGYVAVYGALLYLGEELFVVERADQLVEDDETAAEVVPQVQHYPLYPRLLQMTNRCRNTH